MDLYIPSSNISQVFHNVMIYNSRKYYCNKTYENDGTLIHSYTADRVWVLLINTGLLETIGLRDHWVIAI
ncbi:hypothetical protein OUZ56_004153 [Daphnia magna]|uniref:Uncharacterized protein n=1 Tax=Daphnia magna TaxID=35525 RepID=A0ABQ9YNY3_9CRUS|nr:hypothetical protein OUZ56_004153 [Daphnia magna]